VGCLNKQVLSELNLIDSRPICYTVGSFKDKSWFDRSFYHSTYTVKCCMYFGVSLLKVGLLLCHTVTQFSVPSNGVFASERENVFPLMLLQCSNGLFKN